MMMGRVRQRSHQLPCPMIHAIHYLVMWFFVASVLFHIYLVLFDDFKSFLTMFFGIKPDEEEAY